MANSRRVNDVLLAIGALTQEDLERLGNWRDVRSFYPEGVFDGIEGSPIGVFEAGKNQFEVSATAYVLLNPSASNRALTITDSYAAIVRGMFDGDQPVIQSVDIDFRSMEE